MKDFIIKFLCIFLDRFLMMTMLDKANNLMSWKEWLVRWLKHLLKDLRTFKYQVKMFSQFSHGLIWEW